MDLTNDIFVAGVGTSLCAFVWDGTSDVAVKPMKSIPFNVIPGEILLTGKADAKGRLWVGECYVVGHSRRSWSNSVRVPKICVHGGGGGVGWSFDQNCFDGCKTHQKFNTDLLELSVTAVYRFLFEESRQISRERVKNLFCQC